MIIINNNEDLFTYPKMTETKKLCLVYEDQEGWMQRIEIALKDVIDEVGADVELVLFPEKHAYPVIKRIENLEDNEKIIFASLDGNMSQGKNGKDIIESLLKIGISVNNILFVSSDPKNKEVKNLGVEIMPKREFNKKAVQAKFRESLNA